MNFRQIVEKIIAPNCNFREYKLLWFSLGCLITYLVIKATINLQLIIYVSIFILIIFFFNNLRNNSRFASKEKYFTKNFDNFDFPVIKIKIDQSILYYNNSFLQTFGISQNTIEGSTNFVNDIFLKNNNKKDIFDHKLNKYKKYIINIDDNHQYQLFLPQINQNNDKIDNNIWDFIEKSLIPKIVIDREGVVLKTNNALNFFLDNFISTNKQWNIFSTISAQDQNKLKQKLNDSLNDSNTNKNTSIEVTLLTKHKKTVLLYLSSFTQKIVNKDIIIISLIDITEQKKLEYNLIHAQKIQAIGQLTGGIAHDFNNLLTAMIGFCDLLLIKHPPGDNSFPNIIQIKQNANRSANLIRQLLAFSKKEVIHPKTLNITEIFSELSVLINRLIGEKIKLDIQHDHNTPLIKADQGQLEQVIINLAVNARDAMPKGGKLSIKTCAEIIPDNYIIPANYIKPIDIEHIPPGNYTLIELSDEGSGISKDIIPKVFDPFFSTKNATGGTGLGLFTVHEIIKQAGGYIFLKTSKNKGTIFKIYFKAQAENKNNPSENNKDIDAIFHNEDLTGQETILIVEDEIAVRTFSSIALSNKGYKVLEASCAEEALEILKDYEDEIDLIITDVMMPGMTGTEFIENAKQKYKNIKVIFISGYTEDTFSKTMFFDKNSTFLPKPFTLKQLASKVKEMVN